MKPAFSFYDLYGEIGAFFNTFIKTSDIFVANNDSMIEDQSVREKLLAITESTEIEGAELIQSLWSNYGQLLRVFLTGGSDRSVIVKHIKLPDNQAHPRGWNTDASHQRKLRSYEIETAWYEGLAQQTDQSCKVPDLLGTWQEGGERILVLEDLDLAGFPVRKQQASIAEMKACLSWLANFHAKYMNQKAPGLWNKGSYWHLDTRQDEWHAMTNQPLKDAARAIDKRLDEVTYKTVIHGDAKLANFCFSTDGLQVAAVDFQYVGPGCGMKDVAYFLSSCLHEDDLEVYADDLLAYYFELLEISLIRLPQDIDIKLVINEWTQLYAYAWADFYRFLDGWSPGHWKIHGYSKRMTDRVLNDPKQRI